MTDEIVWEVHPVEFRASEDVTPKRTEKYGDVWLTHSGQRIGCGLYKGYWNRVGMWAHVKVFGRWWGIEVRHDPDVIGSKLMWTFADVEIGWLE